ncbi:TldD/PmbA family protein [Vulgatibacter sp.]|uniref:TldD/PmbA family protein n=1 Tax=Vulgatibacter sp. TaxID=1971226 RepID=UPI003567E2D4
MATRRTPQPRTAPRTGPQQPAARTGRGRAPAAPLVASTPPPPLPIATIERLLGLAMGRGADFAEVYVERGATTSVLLDEGKIKSAAVGMSSGVGIRAIHGARVGYAWSDDLDDRTLDQTARTAAAVAASGGKEEPIRVSRISVPRYYHVIEPLADVAIARKVDLVERADATARAYDRRITQVQASWADHSKKVAVANTEGYYAEDEQDLCRIHVQVVAQGKDGERRTGSYGGGGRVGIGHFDNFRPEDVAREAARQAIATLGAVDAPAGPQTVVLAPGWSGILLHEAIGHGLEADFIRKGTSLYAGKLGEKVASDKVTVIDDGTMANARGSVNVDDEGVPAERKVLIENGILRGYMFDKHNARLMKQKSTGSGRRQSFKHYPLPRMTNTYLAPGDSTPDEIIRSVDRGLYCKHFGGGQVDISNGNFVFEVAEAYLIEKGKLTRPVKNATLIGVGPEALAGVSMVGCDPTPDPGIGTCGKDGQSVPVGVGLPTVRIDGLTVGGTKVGAGKVA